MKVFVVLFFVFLSLPVAASESVVLEYQGVSGFWFPENTADLMLSDLAELQVLRKKVSLLEEGLSLRDGSILLLKKDAEVSQQIAEKWKASFDTQLNVNEEQRLEFRTEVSRLDAWYRAPVLWFSVGFLLAGALATALNFGLSEAR